MRDNFGDRVVSIVKDVTKDETEPDWHARAKAYLSHLENQASQEAVIVSSADKIHNLLSILDDYNTVGDELWELFTTKSSRDQLWWYESILKIIKVRKAPAKLIDRLTGLVKELRKISKI